VLSHILIRACKYENYLNFVAQVDTNLSIQMDLKKVSLHLKIEEQTIIVSKNRFLGDTSHLEPYNLLKNKLTMPTIQESRGVRGSGLRRKGQKFAK
jgi:hypothetical protein